MQLRKNAFKRNKRRETKKNIEQVQGRVLGILKIILLIFFTPAIALSSILIDSILLMVINIVLACGYLAAFLWNAFTGQIGLIECLLTAAGIALAVAASVLLYPLIPAGAGLLLTIFLMGNGAAVAINTFFILKRFVLPPVVKLFTTVSARLGLPVREHPVKVEPLTLKRDSATIAALFKKHYDKADVSELTHDDPRLIHFNNLLHKLEYYLNKYHNVFFGNFVREDDITHLEKCVDNLTIACNGDSSFSFIKKKIGYKQEKLNQITRTIKHLEGNDYARAKPTLKKYFTYNEDESGDVVNLMAEAIKHLKEKAEGQKDKIESLESCLLVKA